MARLVILIRGGYFTYFRKTSNMRIQQISSLVVYMLTGVCLCNTLDGTSTTRPRMDKVESWEGQFAEIQEALQTYMAKVIELENAMNSLAGPTGPPGRDGRDGKDGEDGRDGRDGDDGSNGRDGRDGAPGPQGLPGDAGAVGPKGEHGGAGGTTYPRWGRTTCGLDSALVYVGFIGKSLWNQTGGGINYQCMVNDAEYNSGGVAVEHGSIAGTESRSFNYGVFENEANYQNAPCVVCYANNRASTLMVPGKRNCPTQWHKEYEGYLMAESRAHPSPSTYVCVDEYPEYIRGEAARNGGAILYFNKAVCTKGVHCPEYDADKAITCVVCTS